jgi:hypothetical protein
MTTEFDTRVDYYQGAYGPTIFVVFRDSVAIQRFIHLLRSVPASTEPVHLAEVSAIAMTGVGDVEMLAVRSPARRSVARVDDAPVRFRWVGSQDEWETRAQLLEPFLDGRPGHQYLSNETDDALIEVSFGEAHGLVFH